MFLINRKIVKFSFNLELNEMKSNYLDNQMNLLSIRQKRKDERKDSQYEYSMIELLITRNCPCHCSKKISLKEMIFNELEDYVMESIDIINIAKKSLELEKLKYVLLSKDQLALFNLISKPQNPTKKGAKNKVTNLYEYSRNKEMQLSTLKELIQNSTNINKLSLLHKRFIELIE